MRSAVFLIWAAVACLPVILGGCWPRSQRILTLFENEGMPCLFTGTTGYLTSDGGTSSEVRANEPLQMRVVFDQCESFCATIESAECEVSVQGSVLSVTSRARVSMQVGKGMTCPSACLEVFAECSVGLLPEGTYEIKLGKLSRFVEVPGNDSCGE